MQEQLISTVNEVRNSNFPQLPLELIGAILEVEREGLEDRAGVISRIEQLVDAALTSQENP